ncbi:MAG: hypothetical protein H6733_14440 [Alphaproteobacteria bacterium]|nr:hypothetical protein [Alphaproteobacteria bacterium]
MFGFAKGRIDEDGLTSAVFGLMHYLADAELLYPFMERLARANKAHPTRDGALLIWSDEQLPDEVSVSPWPTLEVPDGMGVRFGEVSERNKGSVTPDALISLYWHKWGIDGRERRCLIYVESEHSKAVEAEQLSQQWVVLRALHPPADELWLLLLNKTPSLPWPEGGRPDLWPGAPKDLAGHDLWSWCAHRAHYLATGDREAESKALPTEAWPNLLHLSWQDCADLVKGLERRSWAYRGLFAGLAEYLALAGYAPAVSWLGVVERGSTEVVEDRYVALAGERPSLLDCDPNKLFTRVGDTYIGASP